VELNQSGMADDKVKNLMEKIDNIEKNGGEKLAEEAKRMKKTIQDNKVSLNSIIEKISELKSLSVRGDNDWWWRTITNISNMKTAIENITDRIKSIEEEIKEEKRMNDGEIEYEWLLKMQHGNDEKSANKSNSFDNLSKEEPAAAQSNSGYVDSFLALLQSVLSAIKSVLSKIIRGNERER